LLSGLSGNVRVVTLSRLVSSTGFSATIPFLAIYLSVVRGIPLTLVGLMYLMQGIVTLLSQIAGGILSDRFGPKFTVLFGNSSSAASAIVMAFAIFYKIPPIEIILLYPSLSLFRGLSIPAQSALLADETTDKITNFSMLAMASNLGFAIGPALGGFLSAYAGYALLFAFNAVAGFITLFLSLLLKEASYHLAIEKPSVRPNSRMFTFVILVFLGYIVIGQDVQPFAVYAGDTLRVGDALIGYIFSFSGLLIVLLQLPTMELLRRLGTHKIVMLSSIVAILSFIMLYLTVDQIGLFLDMAVMTLAEILFVVPTQVWVALCSPAKRRGAYQGYYSAAASTGRSSAAWIGTSFQALQYGARESWLLMTGFALVMMFGFIMHSKKFAASYQLNKDVKKS
jgi:MFS family permease